MRWDIRERYKQYCSLCKQRRKKSFLNFLDSKLIFFRFFSCKYRIASAYKRVKKKENMDFDVERNERGACSRE